MLKKEFNNQLIDIDGDKFVSHSCLYLFIYLILIYPKFGPMFLQIDGHLVYFHTPTGTLEMVVHERLERTHIEIFRCLYIYR
jgi:hypothetical protein